MQTLTVREGNATIVPSVCVVLLNYNGWPDTIECLESLFRCDYQRFKVIVCDNGSTDGSVGHLTAWAEGRLDLWIPSKGSLRGLSYPPVAKPIACTDLDQAVPRGGSPLNQGEPQLFFIRCDTNLGFGAGNNVALKVALAWGEFDYLWILNNDTVVQADTLTQMVRQMSERPGAGICGSTILYYDQPERVQLLGGASFNKWLGTSHLIGKGRPADQEIDSAEVDSRMAFVSGCSMLVSKDFIENIGLMSEDYFLFFEEIDWVTRAQGRYDLAYAPNSRLYHKLGSTIRRLDGGEGKEPLSHYYLMSNAFLFARRYLAYTLPSLYLSCVGRAAYHMLRGQWDRAWINFGIVLSGGRRKIGARDPSSPRRWVS